MHGRALLVALVMPLGAGCVGTPPPLPPPGLAPKPPVLVASPKEKWPGIAPEAVRPKDGLDVGEVATLAALADPDLRVAQADVSMARAALGQARRLPDPSLDLGTDHPVGGPGLGQPLSQGGTVEGFSAAVSYDLSRLVPQGARVASAEANLREVRLSTLWREWQVVMQARLLFARARAEEALAKVLEDAHSDFADRYTKAKAALAAGDVTLSVAGEDLVAVSDIESRLHDVRMRHAETTHALDALLGLAPGTGLVLVGDAGAGHVDPGRVHQAAADLERRRPDLLALRAGYESGWLAERREILAEFPPLTLSLNGARDTGAVDTVGLGLSVDVPIFDGNRGHAAIAHATTGRLRAVYRARLAGALSDLDGLLARQALLERRDTELAARLPDLESAAKKARRAYDAGELDPAVYVGIETALLDERAEQISVRASLEEVRIRLETQMGVPIGTPRRRTP